MGLRAVQHDSGRKGWGDHVSLNVHIYVCGAALNLTVLDGCCAAIQLPSDLSGFSHEMELQVQVQCVGEQLHTDSPVTSSARLL